MQNFIQEAAFMNNEAVSLLVLGSSNQAIRMFKTALAVLNDMDIPVTPECRRRAAADSMVVPKCTLSFEPERNNEATNSDSKCMMCAPVAISTCHETEHTEHFMFSRPFLLSMDRVSTLNTHLCSAVITFNMALAIYAKNTIACELTKNKVLRIYDVILSIVEEMSDVSECTNMIIATLNNKAQIHYERYEFDKAHETYDMLVRLASSPVHISAFGTRDLQECLLNLMIQRKPPLVAGAA